MTGRVAMVMMAAWGGRWKWIRPNRVRLFTTARKESETRTIRIRVDASFNDATLKTPVGQTDFIMKRSNIINNEFPL